MPSASPSRGLQQQRNGQRRNKGWRPVSYRHWLAHMRGARGVDEIRLASLSRDKTTGVSIKIVGVDSATLSKSARLGPAKFHKVRDFGRLSCAVGAELRSMASSSRSQVAMRTAQGCGMPDLEIMSTGVCWCP